VMTITHAYPEKTVELWFFLCQLVAGEPQGMEGQAFAWVDQEDLGRHSFPEADAQLLVKLRQNPGWWK